MPDFDPDNIPVLDDIIDDDSTDANELDNSENEDNLDLFEENETELTAETESQIDIAVKDAQPENNAQDETDSNAAIDPLVLEPIVQSVVEQMMPDLEQQLRFLIQQALEERLPPDIIQLISNKTDDK